MEVMFESRWPGPGAPPASCRQLIRIFVDLASGFFATVTSRRMAAAGCGACSRAKMRHCNMSGG